MAPAEVHILTIVDGGDMGYWGGEGMGICTPVKVNTALIYLIYPPFKHWIVADCLLPLSICFLSLRGINRWVRAW